MAVGDRVFLKGNSPDDYLVEGFSKLSAANVVDCMGRLCNMSPSIRLMSNPPEVIICGVALTVKARSGDNIMLHRAINMSIPGNVVVVSNEGERSRVIIGGVMYSHMQGFKKIVGIVIDGPARDIDVISKGHLLIHAAGMNPAGPYREGPGEVNVPTACGGITVNPGDIILGDKDGVIAIPKQDTAEILERAKTLSAANKQKAENLTKGAANHQWVEDLMEKKNVKIIDDAYNY